MENHVKIRVPFNGFYESVHDTLIDDVIKNMFSDENGNELDIPDDFHFKFSFTKEMMNEYCTHYLEDFCAWLNQEIDLDITLKLESVYSPKYYNYETDQIDAWISYEDLEKVWMFADDKILRETAIERHTSRSGFASFYSPDIDTWPKGYQNWDCIQLETLLLAAMKTQDCPELNDWEIMEPSQCNGHIDSLVWQNMPKECVDIANAFYEEHRANKE